MQHDWPSPNGYLRRRTEAHELVLFVIDATYTFDRVALDGTLIRADELARTTAANLNEELATVLTTAALLG
ncbi:MAG: hypothetical protein LC659_05075 [Myxococcales bacterium]|nr:hypothetical protein [Myxococcales bacterium]